MTSKAMLQWHIQIAGVDHLYRWSFDSKTNQRNKTDYTAVSYQLWVAEREEGVMSRSQRRITQDSIVQQQNPKKTWRGGGGRNNNVEHNSHIFKSHYSPLTPIFCFCLNQDTDHSYKFLILYLLNNDQTVNYITCGQKQSLNRIHSTVSLTNALLFSCLRGLCCRRYTNCKGHNQKHSKV